jgi:lactoylglutathione lyase
MTIEGVSHFGLCVTDLDEALHFYCDVLGFKAIRRSDTTSSEVAKLLELSDLKMSLTFIEMDGTRLELIHFDTPAPVGGGKGPFNRVGYTHLSLKVLEFDVELDRLREAGVTVLEDTIGQVDESNARFAFILDPDGNRVELFGTIEDSGRKAWDM